MTTDATPTTDWWVPMDPAFLAIPRRKLSDPAKLVLLALSARAGSEMFTWVSTAELRAA